MMPLAFVPDWKKSDYIDKRASLDYSEVDPNDLIPLPRSEDIKTDFNSIFTYLTMFTGKYMDEERQMGVGSHDGVDIRAPIGTPVFAIGHGKVVKTRDENNNKYITIEHRDVKYNGKIGKYYSSYLHLSAVLVQPGEIIDKGTLIGRVGMTGFTTTPHLHIQVDNEETPFYPYWPFTLTEAGDAGMSFFDGVDNGLNSSLIMQYSVDPLDFIKNAKSIDSVQQVQKPTETQPITETPKNTTVAPESPTINTPKTPVSSFRDVSLTNVFYDSITYFAKKGILSGYADNTFKSEKTIIRSELLAIVLKSLEIEQHGELLVGIFRDVPPQHWVNPLVSEAVKRKIVTTDRPFFEPNREVTRVEFLAILALASGEQISDVPVKNWSDIASDHWSHKYAEFALRYNLLDNISGDRFRPNDSISRGEIAEAMYRYLKIKQKIQQ